jgi:hypothetical protein
MFEGELELFLDVIIGMKYKIYKSRKKNKEMILKSALFSDGF